MDMDMIDLAILEQDCVTSSEPGVRQGLHSLQGPFPASEQNSLDQAGNPVPSAQAEPKGALENDCRKRLQHDFRLTPDGQRWIHARLSYASCHYLQTSPSQLFNLFADVRLDCGGKLVS